MDAGMTHRFARHVGEAPRARESSERHVVVHGVRVYSHLLGGAWLFELH